MKEVLIETTLSRRELAALAGAAALSLVQGCGSGAGGASVKGRGALTVTIRWPAGRAIPAETRSIKLSVQVLEPDEGLIVSQRVVARPATETLSQAVLDHVPSVKVRVMATAHRAADGTGDLLASGAAEVRVTESGNVPVSITLGAITRIEIRPASVSIDVGQSIQLSAHAFNGEGNEVTVAATSWQWSMTPSTIASIAPGGATAQVTGLVVGGAIASVLLPEAGLSASKNVVVAANVTITITPADATVDCGAARSFSASVPGVTWNATGGVISASGVFTAGDVPGEFAISASTPGGSGSVAVTIKCPSVGGAWQGTLEASDVSTDVSAPDGKTVRAQWFVNVSTSNNTASVVALFEHVVLEGPLRGADLPRIDVVFPLTGSPEHMTGTTASGASIDIRPFALPAGSSGIEFLKLSITGLPGLALIVAELNASGTIIRTEVAPSSTWVSDNRNRDRSGETGTPRSFLTRTGSSPPGDFQP